MKGVPPMTVVSPVSPGGAIDMGILVDDGRTMNGKPPEILALAPGMKAGVLAGEVEASGILKLVGSGTATNGNPAIVVVCPSTPVGTACSGILVGDGMTTCGSPGVERATTVESGWLGDTGGLQPMILQMSDPTPGTPRLETGVTAAVTDSAPPGSGVG